MSESACSGRITLTVIRLGGVSEGWSVAMVDLHGEQE